jgi:hypothetical protein
VFVQTWSFYGFLSWSLGWMVKRFQGNWRTYVHGAAACEIGGTHRGRLNITTQTTSTPEILDYLWTFLLRFNIKGLN